MQEGRTLKADNTLIQTLQRLIENKKAQLILALILVLLAIRLYFPATAPPDAQLVKASVSGNTQPNAAIVARQQYQESLEGQLESVLGQIKGAGQVTVMLTLASSNDVEIASSTQQTSRTTEDKDPSGASKVSQEETLSSQPVMARNTSGDSVVKLKELTPEIRGVVVVASGANDPKMQASLTQAVQTILSLPAHRVRVFPGK
ncbi:MAG: stage III sporulation protein AG [Bacillota bacterium]|nr:MAG: stage III sporulation protein AG [Bacillota bacterium]MBS3951325.1 hypothetical protein [Peptococcaceae bacterium]